MTENKHTFFARIEPIFSPSDVLDVKLAYCLAKFGHRAQVRKELIAGKPSRYFEHVRRVAINMMDMMKIMEKEVIISCLCHDVLEDTDLSAELLEHCFGNQVITMVKILSKVPKEGYIDRLNACHNWKVLAIKACDRLDNLRSLMIPGTTLEFRQRQIKETEEKYLPIFDKLLKICPAQHQTNVEKVVEEIKNLTSKYKATIEKEIG